MNTVHISVTPEISGTNMLEVYKAEDPPPLGKYNDYNSSGSCCDSKRLFCAVPPLFKSTAY